MAECASRGVAVPWQAALQNLIGNNLLAESTRMICHLYHYHLIHGATGLIDGGFGFGDGGGIAIGDGDATERLAADDPRFFPLFPIGIEERVRHERVAVCPAIDGDAGDVASGVEA